MALLGKPVELETFVVASGALADTVVGGLVVIVHVELAVAVALDPVDSQEVDLEVRKHFRLELTSGQEAGLAVSRMMGAPHDQSSAHKLILAVVVRAS
jgi:hypothetical protein